MVWGNMHKKRVVSLHGYLTGLLIVFFLVYCGMRIFHGLSRIRYIAHKDRIQVLVYDGKAATVTSFDMRDGVDYQILFDAKTSVTVPGGYKQYEVENIGKLSYLEKDPLLILRTFSSAISSMVDVIVYPSRDVSFSSQRFSVITSLIRFSQNSNLNFLERMYLAIILSGHRDKPIEIKDVDSRNEKGIFDEKHFAKTYRGYLYHTSLRDENKAVIATYNTSHLAADRVSRILEGEGIRVVDISQNNKKDDESFCQITLSEHRQGMEVTKNFLQNTFGCIIEPTSTIDEALILNIGEQMEKKWE